MDICSSGEGDELDQEVEGCPAVLRGVVLTPVDPGVGGEEAGDWVGDVTVCPMAMSARATAILFFFRASVPKSVTIGFGPKTNGLRSKSPMTTRWRMVADHRERRESWS